MTRIRSHTLVIQVTQKTCFTDGTLAVEGANTVVARGTLKTTLLSAIVLVLPAIVPDPAVDTYTRVSTVRINTGGSVLAEVRVQGAFINILRAEIAGERWWTPARVIVDPVNARGTVLTRVTETVVHVLLTVMTGEADGTLALVFKLADHQAGTTVSARGRVARHILGLAVDPGISRVTATSISAKHVDTAAVKTRIARALVHILGAARPREPLGARALERVPE